MTTRRGELVHEFAGGFASDFSDRAATAIGNDGIVKIPFLIEAQNCVYSLDGSPRKAPGTAKLFTTALESGANIMGVFDAWFSTTSGNSTQHRICNVGTTIKKDDANGTFTNLFTGLSAGEIPTYAMFNDLLIIAMTGSDVPRSWDKSTAQNLAGSPPNFSIVTVHGNRVWAAGVDAQPSRLYYSGYVDGINWNGSNAGFIDIDPDDGDRITGIVSYKKELIVFKGPYKGKIIRIQGTSPAGPDPFRKEIFVNGIGAVWQNAIFTFRDDLGFVWSDGSINSLKAVASFGDFAAVSLSRPINAWLQEHVNLSRLKNAWAASGCDCDYALISLPIDGSTTNNYTWMMDFRFDPVRWARWTDFVSTSITPMVDASDNNRRVFMAGGDDGFIRKYNQNDRSIDDAEITYRVRTPALNYNEAFKYKTLGIGFAQFTPRETGTLDWNIYADGRAAVKFEIDLVADGDPLGNVTGVTNFTLGTSTLSEAKVVDKFVEMEDVGDFRHISYEFVNLETSVDVQQHQFGVQIELGPSASENP